MRQVVFLRTSSGSESNEMTRFDEVRSKAGHCVLQLYAILSSKVSTTTCMCSFGDNRSSFSRFSSRQSSHSTSHLVDPNFVISRSGKIES